MKLPNLAQKHVELSVAVLIGLSSIFIAYTGYMSGAWGGESLEKYSKANQMTNEANTTYLESVVRAGDDMTDAEVNDYQQTYNDQKAEADALIDEADTANKNGDKYTLLSALIASVMFVLSLATILHKQTVRGGVLVFGIVMLLLTLVRLLGLPKP